MLISHNLSVAMVLQAELCCQKDMVIVRAVPAVKGRHYEWSLRERMESCICCENEKRMSRCPLRIQE